MSERSFSQLDRFYEGDRRRREDQPRRSLNFTRLGGREYETDAGPILEIARHYEWTRLPAQSSLATVRESGWRPSFIDPRCPDTVPLERAAFVDIETTGLSLGTGTVPFLVGVVHADTDGLWLKQYLMRDFPEEGAQQIALCTLLRDFNLIVSYNGGRFDLPILRTRAVIHRQVAEWLEHPHLDLLHPVRAIWRKEWPDCRLGTAEGRLLGVVRDTNCEGWEVPLRYRQFLEEQNEEPLVEVLEHNAQDLLSLAGITAVLEHLFDAHRGDFGLTQGEKLGLARALLSRGRAEHSVAVLRSARAMGRLSEGYSRGMRLLVRLLKRRGRWEEAREIWLDLASSEQPLDRVWGLVEEAKAAEHRARAYDRALATTVEAEAAARQMPPSPARERYCKALAHRHNRLQLRLKSR